MLTFPQTKLNPIIDESKSNEESASAESKQINVDEDLNRRSNTDDFDNDLPLSLIECHNLVMSHAGKLRKIDSRQQLNSNHLNSHRQVSHLRRTDIKQPDDIHSIPLRRLPYQPHQRGNKK